MSASPTQDTSSAPTKPFTEKEEKVMKLAWSCLKSPPDIDIEKLREVAEFNTTKTASNTWGVIKKKLAAIAPMAEGEGTKRFNPASAALTSTNLTYIRLQGGQGHAEEALQEGGRGR